MWRSRSETPASRPNQIPASALNEVPASRPNQTPASAPSEITQLDEELYRLARGAGRLRLRIGQALHRLADGIHELGFSTLHAYALERCNRGGRWAAESRTLARRLESLPQLTAALEAGSIGWSMAELLARHATPQTEAALLQVARDKTVHAMRIALSPQSAPGPPRSPSAPGSTGSPNSADSPGAPEPAGSPSASDSPMAPGSRNASALLEVPDDDELVRTLSLTLPVEEAWALEATRMMVEHMDGKHTASHFLESLLAEATISLLELIDPARDDVSEQMEAELTAWRARMQRLQHRQAEAELRSRPAVVPPNPGEAPDLDDLPFGLEALDARIRHYSAELASRDLFFGRVAQRFLGLGGWQALGFVSEAHYAHERLGMSRAALRSKVSLARRSWGHDHVVDALQSGRIGFEAAQLITRIATADTEQAWVERATHRTFKHLREEVQAVEMATRFTAETSLSPPSDSQIEQMQALERAILSGELLQKVVRNPASDSFESTERQEAPTVQISATPSSEAPNNAVQISATPSSEAPNNAVQISAAPHGKVTLRLRVPGDLLVQYRHLERIHRQTLPGTSFIQFLCTTFWRTWVPTLGVSDKWESIYRRDRYRCTNPVCHQRNVTLHHVQYRANGGTHDPDNLTCPCAFCHLEGEHGGRLKILPPGNDPTWLLGRHPIMRIHHRKRTLLN